MIIEMKKWTVKEGHSKDILKKFEERKAKPSIMEQQPGFLGREALMKKTTRGDEQVIMMVRWESEDALKAWKKSPEHIAGHKAKIASGNPKREQPEYIISVEHELYFIVE